MFICGELARASGRLMRKEGRFVFLVRRFMEAAVDLMKARVLAFLVYFRFNLVRISKQLKLTVYKSLKRPVATYGCEAWTLTSTDGQHLPKFVR